jgi:hypothetical protein
MQPKIDSHNRWRQNILALEERFVTQSWPGRYHMTLFGMIVVNTYLACKYQYKDPNEFKPLLADLSYDLMHNRIDLDAAASGFTPATGTAYYASPDGEPEPTHPPTVERCTHRLVPISSFVPDGYAGGKQQHCGECKWLTTWCCGYCSTADVLVPLHPATYSFKGEVQTNDCLHKHRDEPGKSTRCRPSGRKSKRPRGVEG